MGKATNPRPKTGRRRNQPSAPRVIGANDNIATANDNGPISVGGVVLSARQSATYRKAVDDAVAVLIGPDGAAVRLTNGDPAPDLARRREGSQALMELELEITEHLNGQQMQAVRKEIAALEKSRGVELTETQLRDVRGQEGVEYRVTRDAMETMWRDKRITDLQYQGGLAFRKRYELLDPERKLSPPTLDGSRKSGGPDLQLERAVQLKQAMDDLLAFQRKCQATDSSVTIGSGRTLIDRIGRRVFVLREVAGKGASIRSLSTSSRERERLAQALSEALDTAVTHFRAGEKEDDARRKIEGWRTDPRNTDWGR